MIRLALFTAVAVVLTPCFSAAQTPERRILETVGLASAKPDVAHVMMKMEYESSRAADAVSGGEKRLSEFLAAADALKVPGLTWRVWNNVLTAAGYTGTGFAYTRNVVFTLPESSARDAMIARLEDLGARYNSHCVTCIGSG